MLLNPNPNIAELVKEANNSQLHATQKIFASTAVDFVHQSPNGQKPKTSAVKPKS